MAAFKAHQFKTQPPIVSLGGYKPPDLAIKTTKEIEEGSTVENSLYMHVSSLVTPTSLASKPSAVVPENLGKFQRIPDFAKELEKMSVVSTQTPKKQHNMISSEVPTSTVTKSMIRPVSARALSSRPMSALTTHRTMRGTMTRLETNFKTTTTRDKLRESFSEGLKPDNLIKKLTWNISSSRLKIVRTDRFPQEVVSIRREVLEEPLFDSGLRIKFYKGDYKAGVRDGYGTIYYENGDSYKGNWVNGEKHGQGSYFYSLTKSTFTGDWDKNMKHGSGALTLANGDTVEGSWVKDSLQASQVTIRYNSGETFEGAMKAGKRHGNGKVTYTSGSTYQGGWREDLREGIGSVMFKDRSFFEGIFKNDYSAGVGVLVYRDFFHIPPPVAPPLPTPSPSPPPKRRGVITRREKPKPIVPPPDPVAEHNRKLQLEKRMIFGRVDDLDFFNSYQMNDGDIIWLTLNSRNKDQHKTGEFNSGKLNGYGVARYGPFGIYKGSFKEGKRCGQGVMNYTDLTHRCSWLPETEGEYEGEWQDDLRHGKGKMLWPSGIRYEGNFKRDRRHNVTGKIWFGNGDTYEGEWVDDLMHGRGVYSSHNGKVYRGRFKSGDFGGEGLLLFPNGEKYEGQVVSMEPEGRGKMYYNSGNRYHGDFVKGSPNGSGQMSYPNGDVYEGSWVDGMRDGFGKHYYAATKETYEGYWDKDVRDGYGSLKNMKREAVFSGQWKNDQKDGEGEIAYEDTMPHTNW
mmetsp:Transcript_19640/g.36181  ORF Transcript_19640/g.36181 Transcript_19640/m.36181 type:complete len:737 (+) Transcript_19640:5078-7288(+)